MKTILLLLTIASCLILWISIVIFYTPACYNLKTMIDDIDKNGELKKTKAPISWYFTNLHTIEIWTISLPKSEKYLRFEIVEKTILQIQLHRKIMKYIAPIMIICGVTLLMITE